MEPFDTSKYTLQRKEDNTVVRIDGLGGESPEMTQDYYDSQITYHKQVVANLEAQRNKLADFEADNPPAVIEVEEDGNDWV